MTTHTPRPSRLFLTAFFLLLSISVVGCGSSPSGTSGFGLPTAPSTLTAPLSVPLAEAPEVAVSAAPTSVNPVASLGGESRTASASLDDLDDLEVEVIGLVEDITGSETCPMRSFSIRDRRVTTSELTRYEDVTCDTLAARQVVKVEGTGQPNGSILARKVERRDEARPAGQVELRGLVGKLDPASACPTRAFDIGADHVIPSGGTRYEGLTCETLANGQNVKVEGTRRASDSAVLAHKIERRDAPGGEVEVRGTISGLSPAGDCLPTGTGTRTFLVGAVGGVGGERIQTSAATRYEDTSCAELANGQNVKVEGTRQLDGSILARKVEGRRDGPGPGGEVEVRGTISGLSPAGDCLPTGTGMRTFLVGAVGGVGGERIQTSAATRYEDTSCAELANGQNVKVEGTHQLDGAILARKVEGRRDGPGPGGEVEVRGLISNLGPVSTCPTRLFDVGGDHIVTSAVTRYDDDVSCETLATGLNVKVEGRRQLDGSILARKVERRDGPGPGGEVEVRGLISNLGPVSTCPNRTFDLGTDHIIPSRDTRYEDVTCATLANGQSVKVEGTRTSPNTIAAREIERRRDGPGPGGEVEVRGLISNLGPASACPTRLFDVGGDHIVPSLDTRYEDVSCATLANGQSVKVEGTRTSPNTIAARKVERRRDGPGPGGEVEVRGLIRNLGGMCSPEAKTFSVVHDLGTDQVITSPSTRYDDTSCAALLNTMKVEVKGTRQADRVILASRIKKDD